MPKKQKLVDADASTESTIEEAPAVTDTSSVPATPRINETPEVDADDGTIAAVSGEAKENDDTDVAVEPVKTERAMPETVFQIAIDSLKIHSLSEKIYTTQISDDLVNSVAVNGILQPILVARATMQIVSGHSRYEAARRAKMVKVPVVFFESDDELEIRRAVLESNKQREKTPEQKVREYNEHLAIERELAKRRMATNVGEGKGVQNVTQADKGKSRDKAAEKVGLSGVTAEKGAAILRIADAFKENGEAAKGAELLTTLNTKSINAANTKAKALGLMTATRKTTKKTAKKATKVKPVTAINCVLEPPTRPDNVKISSHDDAFRVLDKMVDFIRAQEGKAGTVGRTREWKDAIDTLIDSLLHVGIKVA